MSSKYAAYKTTGIPWIGEVPEHWEVKRLGMLGRFSSSGIDKLTLEGEPLVSMVNYLDIFNNSRKELWNRSTYMVVSCPLDKVLEHGLKQGDMVFTPSSETADEVAFSAVIMEDLDNTVYSYHVVRYRLNEPMALHFKKYLCNNHAVLNQFSALCKGTTRQILTRDSFQSVSVAVPPIAEQLQIARYLDHKTALIDAYLARKRRMMTLLKEQRQALISQAVTKGLDPNAPMKDSGVEWIGEVPEHWEVLPIKRGLDFLTDYEANGSFASVKDNVSVVDEGGYAWYVRATDLENGKHADPEACKWVDEPTYKFLEWTELFPGDLLIAKRGEIGKVYLMPSVTVPATLAPNLYLLRFTEALLPEFVYYYLWSDAGQRELRNRDASTTIGALYKEDCKSIPVPFCPVDEQKAIIEFIVARTKDIDDELTRIEASMERVREYRQALISAVVTGKVDVRGVEVPEEDPMIGGSDDEMIEEDMGMNQVDVIDEQA
jgi:type I restriction enzyme S subunit